MSCLFIFKYCPNATRSLSSPLNCWCAEFHACVTHSAPNYAVTVCCLPPMHDLSKNGAHPSPLCKSFQSSLLAWSLVLLSINVERSGDISEASMYSSITSDRIVKLDGRSLDG